MHLGFNLLFLIPGETGGRETYARRLIAALYELEPGLRATAFVNRDISAGERRGLGATMRVVRVPTTPRRPASWAAGEIGQLPVSASRAGIDLLHSMANFGPAGGRFRRVQTLHDVQYRAVPALMSRPRRIATGVMLGLAARHADRIITGSEASARDVTQLPGIDPGRIVVTPYAASPPPPVPTAAVPATRQRLALGNRPAVLTVATHLPHKNLRLVIAALAAIVSSRRPVAILVGHGTDHPELRAAADAAGVGRDVRMLGSVPQDELEVLYALADCLLLPTRYEGFGLPALEAMVRDVPVVCSDIAPLREITGDAALRFDPDSADEAAAAIERVLADLGLARRLAAAGRERALRYSWAAAAQATLAVYHDALAAR